MNRFLFSYLLLSLLTFKLVAQVQFSNSSFQLVNTSSDEQSPILTPDGKTLYYTVQNHPLNTDGKRDPGDIWYSTWADSIWSAPVHAGALINNRGYNAVGGFSPDGLQMFFLCHYDASGVARTQGISVSKKTSGGWSRPENIFIPYFQNKSSIQSGHLSPDNSVFIYSAETYGSYGVDDLYVTIRGSDGKWSDPKNLGTIINTQFQELSPSLSSDTKTLYFSSNGRKGSGSFDVYSSERLDDSYTNWTIPVNLGSGVNSDGRELYYKTFENIGITLFTSTKNSDGYGDIKFIGSEKSAPDSTFIAQPDIPETISIVEEEPEQEVDNKFFRIYGKITNARSGEIISARVSFVSQDTVINIEAGNSGFRVAIPPNVKYHVDLEASGFISALEKIDLESITLQELEMNFSLQPIVIGTTVNLKNVLFIQSQPELLPESYPELDLVVAFMKANPHVEIELAGHTDNRGSFRALMELSQKRVNTVKSYMVSKGIDKKRISGKGYGGSKPIAGNDTEEQRMLNRRVEFVIKKL